MDVVLCGRHDHAFKFPITYYVFKTETIECCYVRLANLIFVYVFFFSKALQRKDRKNFNLRLLEIYKK